MPISPHCRFYSSQEILAIAERIRVLVERERIIKLKPATGWLVEGAVRAYAAQPNRQTVMDIICGNSRCEWRSKCTLCMGKANAIMRLYERPGE